VTRTGHERLKKNDCWTGSLLSNEAGPHFGVCTKNTGCEDLQVRKLYPILPDEIAGKAGLLVTSQP
jgi:hypothetical protein